MRKINCCEPHFLDAFTNFSFQFHRWEPYLFVVTRIGENQIETIFFETINSKQVRSKQLNLKTTAVVYLIIVSKTDTKIRYLITVGSVIIKFFFMILDSQVLIESNRIMSST